MNMERDTLFLLKEAFVDGGGQPYFCPDCATVNGVLSYFPALRHDLDVRYVDFQRPRSEIVALLDEAHQGWSGFDPFKAARHGCIGNGFRPSEW